MTGRPTLYNPDEILDLWAAGRLTSGQIARKLGTSNDTVRGYITRARKAGDPRAAYRLKPAKWQEQELERLRQEIKLLRAQLEMNGISVHRIA